jgi:hypothetical protein
MTTNKKGEHIDIYKLINMQQMDIGIGKYKSNTITDFTVG